MHPLKRAIVRRISISTAWQLAIVACVAAMLACAPTVTAQLTPRPSDYVSPGAVASPVRSFLFAFGDRIRRPGKERVTFTGRYTDRIGATDVSLVWEIPGRFRLDRADKPGRPIIYDETRGWVIAGAVSLDEANGLETLFNDTSESFFYEMVKGAGHRFLGNRFRTDNGKMPNYKGPWYDLYEVFAEVRTPISTSKRRKVYFFDSQSGLLSRVEYVTAGAVRVTTEFSGWQNVNGQAFPATVVRKENGQIVLLVNFTNVSLGSSASDGVFPGH